MINLILGINKVRANSTNIAQAITDMRKQFNGGDGMDGVKEGHIMQVKSKKMKISRCKCNEKRVKRRQGEKKQLKKQCEMMFKNNKTA